MRGKFIVFEGIDGCGKSTQINILSRFLFDLSKKNHVLITREPTLQSEQGIQLNKLLKNQTGLAESEVFLNLFVGDRRHHIENLINPTLEYGGIVICDRYILSTLAYQQAQGQNLNNMIAKHRGLPVPDLTLLFDISPEHAMQRIDDSGRDQKTLFEKIEFLKKVRLNYLELSERLPEHKVRIIDASRSIEEIHKKILEVIKKERLFEDI
ncbi:MAG: dTMP kinase [Candidatus Nanoarchaeia archaeon]|nr:dTMP kinase [Candidatus Nanoarchaeia archaeon]